MHSIFCSFYFRYKNNFKRKNLLTLLRDKYAYHFLHRGFCLSEIESVADKAGFVYFEELIDDFWSHCFGSLVVILWSASDAEKQVFYGLLSIPHGFLYS